MTRNRGAYALLLDEETWAFVEETDRLCPPGAADMTVAQQRRAYDAMCRQFFAGYPSGVSAHDEGIDAGSHVVPVRVYESRAAQPKARVVYFHGGGFVVGGLDSHDDVCAEICGRTGHSVVSVDYRLAPEHCHPAAFDDALDGYEWARGRDSLPVILVGDSAGGNLAAAVAHAKREAGVAPAGLVLLYPKLGGDRTRGSYVMHAEAPMLALKDLAFYKRLRTNGRDVANDPTLAPLADSDFSGLPPTVVISAECDPLSSDGEAYCERIRAAGGRAVWFNEAGLVHGFLRARHGVARARASFTRTIEAIETLAEGRWPYE